MHAECVGFCYFADSGVVTLGQRLLHVDKIALCAAHPPVEEGRCPDGVCHGDAGGHGFLRARDDADDHGEVGSGDTFRVRGEVGVVVVTVAWVPDDEVAQDGSCGGSRAAAG